MLQIKATEFAQIGAAEADGASNVVEDPVHILEEVPMDMAEEPDTILPSKKTIPKKKATTMKVIVWVCLLNGLAWVWCSYILAWMGREQIAESLSQVALTEIIGVVLVYAIKAAIENLSKNNSWPDKHDTDSGPPNGVR